MLTSVLTKASDIPLVVLFVCGVVVGVAMGIGHTITYSVKELVFPYKPTTEVCKTLLRE